MDFAYCCPKCGEKLTLLHKSYVCGNGHCYDKAKSGYVNLVLANQKNSADAGDNKEMISARLKVMDSGYYKKLSDDLIYIINKNKHDVIVDAGCGVGYLPYRIAKQCKSSQVLGLDISKNAIIAASKKYKDINFAVASSVRLPLATHSVDILICAFAPVFAQEFLRVLSCGGLFLRVVPNKRHLYSLKQILYQSPYENQMDKIEIDGFEFVQAIASINDIVADGDLLHSIVQMTPYYYHSNQSDIASLLKIDSTTVNLDFEIRVYKKI